ncbi:hypothetical protein PG985_004664 [Apiospora marii]|uniref:Uncharacterized protein n=1 Tax=Apiospora marii TaxID=335849 RepID=A0ABR1S9Z7_9PEZI
MFTSIIAVLSAAALAAAAPSSSPALAARQEAPFAKWPAINFSGGCAPNAGGCIALFNISAPAGYVARAPAFAATCHPLVNQKGVWLDCDDHMEPASPRSHVETTWADGSRAGLIQVSVAHIWTEASGQRNNASGSAEINGGMATFEVPVTMLTAVL